MGAPTAAPVPLDADGIRRLVETIDETPETVIPIHLLTQGTCAAYAVGDPASSDAVIVQSDSLREEPFGLGGDAQGLWDLLRHLDDWTCRGRAPARRADQGRYGEARLLLRRRLPHVDQAGASVR